MSDIYDFQLVRIDDQEQSARDYKGKVLLIVNTASKCGFTPQYHGLQELYERYRDRGFEVLGFPCNQFCYQEPGSDSEIQEFCRLNFGVTFPLFKKVKVNGRGASPLFVHLKEQAPGILGSHTIKWNFSKFLVSRNGEVIRRYANAVKPDAICGDIEKLLEV